MTSPQRLLQLLTLLDVTRLQEVDDEYHLQDWLSTLPVTSIPVAAFCVYPSFLRITEEFIRLHAPGAALATVVNFPDGNQSLTTVLADITAALANGANEIDCVMPYHTLLAGDERAVLAFLSAVRQASSGACLKIIIESGELLTAQQTTKATELVIACGAEFVKTSTGKVPVGVTLEAARIILTSIAAADRPIGFKASGGVKTVAQALDLMDLYENITGKSATPANLRIGASTLLTELCQQLTC
ncbi:deoxyribose-phosphate aldolase [Alishewanella longhuensis]|uniref:Deoxyribose-phosphate aldolase n=1 Tax=Alishewanella longhuensis TaxID=1091037 RepID=A0ABQ3L079_9ALTE|nr:deoxyribose-phosphate aldolase [Alishewanella longhuensis]GHG70747.1 deoxyribose-phosphate aldolase [Alishewanella longhuensis]